MASSSSNIVADISNSINTDFETDALRLTRPMRTPWQISRSVWYALILRELQTMFWSRRFGAFWVLAEPMATLLVMVTLFSYMRGQGMSGLPFALWLTVGIVSFTLMRGIIFSLMAAVSANQSLFTYRQVKPFDTYIARTIVQVFTNISVYVILVLGMVFLFHYDIPIYKPIQMIATLAVMVVLGFAAGVLFSLLTHAFPNLSPIIRLMFLPLYFTSGVLFPVSWVPQPYYDWLLWNPFLNLIDMFRQYSFEQYTPMVGVTLDYPLKFTLVVLFIAVLTYRRRQLTLLIS